MTGCVCGGAGGKVGGAEADRIRKDWEFEREGSIRKVCGSYLDVVRALKAFRCGAPLAWMQQGTA